MIDVTFASRDLFDWVDALQHLTTPWTVVKEAAEAANDPQVTVHEFMTQVEGPTRPFPVVASPAQFDGVRPEILRAPEHGRHTLELGRSWEEISELKALDAIL